MSRPFANLTRVWAIIDRLGDLTAIPDRYSIHILSLQLGFFDSMYPKDGLSFRLWYRDPPSLFMNGMIFFQIRFPFWIGLQLRLPYIQHYFQCGTGWKGNGRLAVLFRFQTDASSAAGMDGANTGQALGLNDGTK